MLRTNINKTVMESVQGQIHHPTRRSAYVIDNKGNARVLPSVGGITYNVAVGDDAFGWECDHVEPGVSLQNTDTNENLALFTLACIGNTATVISGDAKGAKGYVSGKHGGIEHTILSFKQTDMEKMAIGDKVIIKSWGQGLKLLDYPDISLMSIDPDMFLRIPILEEKGKIKIPVAAEIPAYLMGSGIGSPTAHNGDYDIMTGDMEEIRRLGLNKLKLGDLVLLRDCDNTYGRGYLAGAVSIGVVVHSDCVVMGHGPGVTTIMSCKTSQIEGLISNKANIKEYIK
jgi:hypothetical protein